MYVRLSRWQANLRLLLVAWLGSCRCTELVQVVNDVLGAADGKDRSGRQRSRHRLTPGFQHFLELPSNVAIDLGVCVHVRLIEIATEIHGVRRANVLDDRIEHIQCRQLARWRSLEQSVPSFSSTGPAGDVPL